MSLADLIFSRLYIRGSLRNTPQGARFALKNSLTPANIVGLTRIELAGRKFLPAEVIVETGGKAVNASQISREAPLALALGATVDLIVPGASIPAGEQPITVGIITRETGEVAATITDTAG